MGDRLATIDIGQKVGAAVALSVGKHNVSWAEAYLRTKWYHHPSSSLASIDMG